MKIAALLKKEIQREGPHITGRGAGVDQANLWRFVNKDSDIRLSSVQALLDYFGYVVVKKKEKKKEKVKRRK